MTKEKYYNVKDTDNDDLGISVNIKEKTITINPDIDCYFKSLVYLNKESIIKLRDTLNEILELIK